jgi:hypothetical protein
MGCRLIALIFLLLGYSNINAQVLGCTDPIASNYNSLATINNGSCVYPSTSVNLDQVCLLPSILNETSSLVVHNGHLYTHLDSGGPNTLFEIDTLTGQVLQKIILTNATNYDWEEMCADNTNLYIGDFGNNNGNRTDLKVYKLTWAQLGLDTLEYDTVQTIKFTYQDQTDFTANLNQTKWDCEAMIVYHDSIFLFTKDWVTSRTKLYSFATTAGTHTAVLLDSFNTAGLITGASIDTVLNQIYLVGYTTGGLSLLWSLYGYNGSNFLKSNKRHIELGFAGQTEGIAILPNGSAYISNERYSFFPARLALMETKNWNVETGLELVKKKIGTNYSFLPNPASEMVYILSNQEKTPYKVRLTNALGCTVLNIEATAFNVSNLETGLYFIYINNIVQQKLIVQH